VLVDEDSENSVSSEVPVERDNEAARGDLVSRKRTTNMSQPDASSQRTIFKADGSFGVANPSTNNKDWSFRVRRALILYLASATF
jgi:hypothetical protein